MKRLGLLCLSVVAAAPAFAQDEAKALYDSRCAVCHGVKGDGMGIAAYLLEPAPRDFTKGVFKFRSTASGELPTEEDLLRTVTLGIPGTGMPPSVDLSEEQRKTLVGYLKRFSTRFAQEPAPKPLAIGTAPEATAARVAKGKELYLSMGCGACHGAEGRGDGPSAAALKDEDGRPIRAFDFTRKGRMKGGSTPADVYRTFSTGLDGTPMPSYADQLSADDRWSLSHYVLSMAEKSPALPATVTKLSAAEVASLPTEPKSPDWALAAEGKVLLRTLWAPRQGAELVSVRAATDGKGIAFLLEWEDGAPNLRALRPEDYPDAAAVQFPVADDGSKPTFAMGEKGRPVNIWQWRADWQADLSGRADVDTQFPGMHVSQYPFAQEVVYATGEGAGNPMSLKARKSPALDMNATALATLTAQSVEGQDVSASGIHSEGKWKVVLHRPLSTFQAADVQFAGRRTVPVAFAVWDGGAGDRNGQKRVSFWVDLELPDAVAKLAAAPVAQKEAPVDAPAASCTVVPAPFGLAALALLRLLRRAARRSC